MTSRSKAKVLHRWHPNFEAIINLVAKEAGTANWANSEGMRVIAQAKFGIKISKFEGRWDKIKVIDETKYAWMLLKL